MTNKCKKDILIMCGCALLLIGVFFACVYFDNCNSIAIRPSLGFANNPNSQYIGAESLGNVGAIYEFDTVPYKFVGEEFEFEIEDIQHLNVTSSMALSGTINLNFFSLDPTLPNYHQSKKRLEPFLSTDRNYEFTLYVPPVGAASKIYINESMAFDYGNTDEKARDFESMSTFIPLIFPSAEKLFQKDFPFKRLSIEYISDANSPTFFEPMLVGENKAIKTIINSRLTINIVILAFLVVSLATFLVFYVINKDKQLILKALLAFSMIVYLAAVVFGGFLNLAPYLTRLLKAVAPIAIAFIALVSLQYGYKKNNWKRIAFYSAAAIGACLTLFTIVASCFELEFLLVSITLWYLVIALFVFSILLIWDGDFPNLFSVMICLATAFMLLLPKNYFPLYTVSPYVFSLAFVAILLNAQELMKYRALKKNNDVLMHNFSQEVAAQTQNIQNVIDQKNQLLSFISHDLKKPARFMENFLNVLKERESDPKLVDLTNIILSKNTEMISALSTISQNTSQNVTREPLEILDVNDLTTKVFKYIEPDCAANGIVLKLHNCKKEVLVSAQKNELMSVLTNLIFNAIEHSHCETIDFSTTVVNGFCFINVVDNGIGIDKNLDVFKPFISSNDTADNVGLGLFLCKNKIENMGGKLSFAPLEVGVKFTVKLQKV